MALDGLCSLSLTLAMADDPAYCCGGMSVGRARANVDENQAARDALGGAPVSGITSNERDNAYKLFGCYTTA